MGISSAGVGSNLDIESIITSLMNVEKKPLTLVTTQKTTLQTKLSAYGTLKSSLSTFQTAVSNLASASKFNAQTVAVGDATVTKATADGNATNGDYALTVTKLAQAQKIASAGFATVSDTVGTGTLTLALGTYDSIGNTFTANANKTPVTVTIDSSNNSLAGIRDAINASGAGVTATIVNDGQTNGNRLVITSKDTGEINSVKITAADDDLDNLNNSGLSQLAYDPTASAGAGKNMAEKQTAQNAVMTLDGIAITKPSNTITDAISGVTLNLLKTGSSSLSVSRDSDTIKNSVQAFVDAYNSLNSSLRSLTKYDETGKSNGALLGDSTTRSISTQIKQIMVQTMGSGTINSLSQIGVGFQRDGTLALDSAKLTTALNTDSSAISGLFAATGKSTDALLKYSGNTTNTQAGTYAVSISQLATRGTLTASAAPGLNITQGVDNHLDFAIDGVNYGVDLTAGNYASADALMNEIQTKLTAAGSGATLSLVGGAIKVTSLTYGSSSSATVSGNGASGIFGTPGTTTGIDVAGTINGQVATGHGQSLVGATGDASEGLNIAVSGGALGARGSVSFTMGYAYQLNAIAKKFLDTDGLLESKTDSVTQSISRLSKQEDALNLRLASIEKRYRTQFTALDATISKMTTTSTYLTQQIAQINANSSSSKN